MILSSTLTFTLWFFGGSESLIRKGYTLAAFQDDLEFAAQVDSGCFMAYYCAQNYFDKRLQLPMELVTRDQSRNLSYPTCDPLPSCVEHDKVSLVVHLYIDEIYRKFH